MIDTAIDVVVAFVALYPLVTSAVWIAGGTVFWLGLRRRERRIVLTKQPPVTILIPAYNEAAVIERSVLCALETKYPNFKVMVLDDGSTDDTAAIAARAGAGDERLVVVRDPVNRGKADRLNVGFVAASTDLVVVIDADAQLHPLAVEMLVERIESSARIAAVAGNPRVTNRRSLLAGLQVLEFSSIIGLIRRTQALAGTVGTVAGIIGIFRREPVLAVGGYDPRMATEDIELTYRLLRAGWDTDYEPRALVGMEVPSKLSILWRQRRRWGRGQGEVLHRHLLPMLFSGKGGQIAVAIESSASLAWVYCSVLVLLGVIAGWIFGPSLDTHGLALSWGVAVGIVSVLQLAVALSLEHRYDQRSGLAFLLGPLYPAAYWMLSAAAALTAEGPAFVRGARGERVSWNTQRPDAPGAPVEERPSQPQREAA